MNTLKPFNNGKIYSEKEMLEILDKLPDKKDYEKYKKEDSLTTIVEKEPEAIKQNVMNYVNMVVGLGDKTLGPENIWAYLDPATGKKKSVEIDLNFIDAVEGAMGINNTEQKEMYRISIVQIYGYYISKDESYDFMDNHELVKAVTDVMTKS